MRKFNKILTTLLLSGLFGVSSCALFNDKDIEIPNHYNPPAVDPGPAPGAIIAGGVEGKTDSRVTDTLCFKNINYAVDGKIPNSYKGEHAIAYTVNGGEDYPATDSSNLYDLYVPNTTPKNEKHVVLLFVHGGAWVSGVKEEVNPYVHEFANKGYITATVKYTLLKQEMDDPTRSIFRDLDEIDACILSMKNVLTQLGFDTTKSQFVIGGASSGAHLAMLYSYSRGARCPLGQPKFIVDAVGPTDIQPKAWKKFINGDDAVLTAGISKTAIEAQETASNIATLDIAMLGGTWNEYQTMRIANGMCGMPFTLEQVEAEANPSKDGIGTPGPVYASMVTNVNGGENLLSVTHYITSSNKIPLICAYGGKDTVVGINQYANLQTALIGASYVENNDYKLFYFKECGHTDINEDTTQYEAFMNQINNWCQDLLA